MDVHNTTRLPSILSPPALPQQRYQPQFLSETQTRQIDGASTRYHPTANPKTSSISRGAQACQRCREQKLRCSRDSPTCERCQRASTPCVYPLPPDRKLLAARRVRKSRFRPYIKPRAFPARAEIAEQPDEVPETSEERSSPPVEVQSDRINRLDFSLEDGARDHSQQITPSTLTSSNCRAQSPLKCIPIPSPEVARLLIELYFTRVYNATLLFHKEAFLADYGGNKLPNFLIHAIFALASIFLPAPSKDAHFNDSETELGISALSTSKFRTFAHEWATVATQQALAQAVEPRIQIIQAFQVLTLYWFSKDALNQVHILSSLAYTSCRLLGFHISTVEDTVVDELAVEMKRRCLWASWVTSCISQGNASFKNESWSEVVGLPFPADQVSFSSGKPELTEAFDENGRIVPQGQLNKSKRVSVMGELVKLYSIWWQTQRFVRSHQDNLSGDSANRLQEFLELDRRLEHYSQALHVNFKYSGPLSFTSTKQDSYTLFTLQCLYRLCACALNSSLVPLFSSTSLDPEISKKVVRMCAEEAVRHSAVILDMASAFLNTRPDISRLSSMTGYAMFVASAVQILSLGAQGKLQTYSGHLKAAITIFRNLNEFWCPLRGLWIKLVVISSFAGLDLDNFSVTGEEYHTPAAIIQTNIEQIISHEAASENGIGTDIYTYVARVEPGSVPQQSPPARIISDCATVNACLANDESRNRVTRQVEQGESSISGQSQIGIDRLIEAGSASEAPFSFANSQPIKISRQRQLQASFDRDLCDANNNPSSATERRDLCLTTSSPQLQLYSSSTNQSIMPSEQVGAHRPIMNGFENTNSMMGMKLGMDMDLGDEEDDFWWTRSWGSVRMF